MINRSGKWERKNKSCSQGELLSYATLNNYRLELSIFNEKIYFPLILGVSYEDFESVTLFCFSQLDMDLLVCFGQFLCSKMHMGLKEGHSHSIYLMKLNASTHSAY